MGCVGAGLIFPSGEEWIRGREGDLSSLGEEIGWGGNTAPLIRTGIKMGDADEKSGLGFPLRGESGKVSCIWDKATGSDETRHLHVLSSFGAPRTWNSNIGPLNAKLLFSRTMGVYKSQFSIL